jgi:glycosyltransferase involved in cell wall biosynthesis
MGWPVVCSDVYPYRTDDPPVLRVKNSTEEWIDAIESLFDPKTRHAKGDALYQWVSRKYLLSNKTSTWFKAIFE